MTTSGMMPDESATPDLVELSRRLNEAVNRGDFDTAVAMDTPDAVYDWSPMDGEVIKGRDALRGFLEDWFGAYEEWEQVAEEERDLGNGVGFGAFRQRARPADSSGFVELHYAFVAIVRWDGRIERVVLYADLDEARAAGDYTLARFTTPPSIQDASCPTSFSDDGGMLACGELSKSSLVPSEPKPTTCVVPISVSAFSI